MVWQAIAFYAGFVVLLFLWARSAGISRSLRDRLEQSENSQDAWKLSSERYEAQAAAVQKDYDRLLEKIRDRANLTQGTKKEDDSVIHARNAGDVRRQFEKAVGGRPDASE